MAFRGLGQRNGGQRWGGAQADPSESAPSEDAASISNCRQVSAWRAQATIFAEAGSCNLAIAQWSEYSVYFTVGTLIKRVGG